MPKKQARRIPSPLKYHGGKSYLASKLIPLMPPHLHYVEPYAGGLSVLLAKDPEGVSEVVNDLNGDLTCFWEVLAWKHTFNKFVRQVQASPFSEKLWNQANANGIYSDDELVAKALTFFVRCRQSLAVPNNAAGGKTKRRETECVWTNY